MVLLDRPAIRKSVHEHGRFLSVTTYTNLNLATTFGEIAHEVEEGDIDE